MCKLNDLSVFSNSHLGCRLRAVALPRKESERDEHPPRLRRAILVVVVGFLLSVGAVDAAGFTVHANMNIPGLDYSSIDVPSGLRATCNGEEVDHCQRICDSDPRCMAFTWVRRGVQGSAARCWFKQSSRLFENHGLGLLTYDTNTMTGVKVYNGRPCWARHIGNLKFCNVFRAGTTTGGHINPELICPDGATAAPINNRAVPGQVDWYCVTRLANDPGGLPNCTDAFGGDAREAGVLGNHVNHSCLDTN